VEGDRVVCVVVHHAVEGLSIQRDRRCGGRHDGGRAEDERCGEEERGGKGGCAPCACVVIL
jgi:hypothetical protein